MKIDFMLQWLSENFNQLKLQNSNNENGRWLEPEIICYRGVLTTLLSTPYDTEEGWIICAAKFKGSIYLCSFDTDAKKQRTSSQSAYQNKCTAWGYKFEQYLLTDKPSGMPDLSVPLNQNEEFYCVFKAVFGNTTLLYGAEVDGISSEHEIKDTLVGKNVELIELKTLSFAAFTRRGEIKHERATRILKWWLQSHIVGIKRIICGCRNYTGIVYKIKKFTLDRLKIKFKNHWSFETCSSFCSAFFEHMKAVVSQECDKRIYQFTYCPNESRIKVQELIPSKKLEYMFLHDSYITEANQHLLGTQ
ncbi:decapping and exoribonuclease protein-like isoform X2 [Nomia melanderi]|nr:decapping and exoribonuclease protein-like isoform X2 [Nomia melanderi]